jgi:aminotransferase
MMKSRPAAVSFRVRRHFEDPAVRARYDLNEIADGMSGVIALGRGDPDLPTPAHIRRAAKAAVDAGTLDGADPAGMLDLRRAISAKLAKENGIEVDPHTEVVVTTGGQEGLYLAVQSLVGPGDEIMVPDPRYTSYDLAIAVSGATMKLIPTSAERGFELQPADVAAAVTPRSKVLLLISPSNPTGAVISADSVEAIATIAKEHDLTVIADEIYEKLLYNGAQCLSVASLPGMRERTLTLNGFSKTFCMTGWRVGYIAGPASRIARIRRLKAAVSSAAPVISQMAAVAALNGSLEFLHKYLTTYDRRRRVLMDGFRGLGFSFTEPSGAYYLFVDSSSKGFSGPELAVRLLRDARVLVYPGTGFGERWRDYLRLSFMQSESTLSEAIERIRQCL